MQKKDSDLTKSLTTMLPMLALGMGLILALEYFGKEKKEPPGKGAPVAPTGQVGNQITPAPSANKESDSGETDQADFSFIKGTGNTIQIETDHYLAVLSSQGGRIDKFYLKSDRDLQLPVSVIKKSGDPLAIQHDALEITRGNGMDFQPHVYFWDEHGGHVEQVGEPPLNQALFAVEGPFKDAKTGIQEVRFILPVVFKGQHLELTKIYRFLPGEYYFHQITTIQNLDSTEFVLGGDLFYKPFGDIGPTPESQDSRVLSTYGRFFYYGDSLSHRANVPGAGRGMSCSFSGCGKGESGPYTSNNGSPNTLQLMGSTSRYFIGYTKFLTPNDSSLQKPDGVIMVNDIDPKGRETFTAFFKDFRLSPAEPQELDLGSVSGDTDASGKFLSKSQGNRAHELETQRRKDVLVVDNQVYFGVRRDESHMFRSEDLANAEFGSATPDAKARDVIYSSGFMALFSKIRDAIVWLMRFLYAYIGNYGWVIIIIAGGFKILTWPLNQMQAKSMRRMQLLKPQIEAINEKYKDNPQEKQKKTMELYSKNNVNPAKGCLPVLIQIPIFIALYSAFSESVELWRSPFLFWMKDLSAPDTVVTINYFVIKNFNVNILPLFMVGSQLLQQMTTTVATDSQQKTLMMMMPIIMVFFFWNMPSGVTLYWTIQNIITVLWQVLFQISHDEKVA